MSEAPVSEKFWVVSLILSDTMYTDINISLMVHQGTGSREQALGEAMALASQDNPTMKILQHQVRGPFLWFD